VAGSGAGENQAARYRPAGACTKFLHATVSQLTLPKKRERERNNFLKFFTSKYGVYTKAVLGKYHHHSKVQPPYRRCGVTHNKESRPSNLHTALSSFSRLDPAIQRQMCSGGR